MIHQDIIMKILLILVLLISSSILSVRGDDQKKVIDKFAAIAAKCDVGYRVVFNKDEPIPIRIDFLFADRSPQKTLDTFSTAHIGKIGNEDTNSRVFFIGRIEEEERITVSFQEKDGKIRLHDIEKKVGYWVDTVVFVDSAVEMSKGKKKAIR